MVSVYDGMVRIEILEGEKYSDEIYQDYGYFMITEEKDIN